MTIAFFASFPLAKFLLPSIFLCPKNYFERLLERRRCDDADDDNSDENDENDDNDDDDSEDDDDDDSDDSGVSSHKES